jgi:hypothetical protein
MYLNACAEKAQLSEAFQYKALSLPVGTVSV